MDLNNLDPLDIEELYKAAGKFKLLWWTRWVLIFLVIIITIGFFIAYALFHWVQVFEGGWR
jgi:hypothetical protein